MKEDKTMKRLFTVELVALLAIVLIGNPLFADQWDVKQPVTATWTSATAQDTTLSVGVLSFATVAVSIRVTAPVTAGALVFEGSDDSGANWYQFDPFLQNYRDL